MIVLTQKQWYDDIKDDIKGMTILKKMKYLRKNIQRTQAHIELLLYDYKKSVEYEHLNAPKKQALKDSENMLNAFKKLLNECEKELYNI